VPVPQQNQQVMHLVLPVPLPASESITPYSLLCKPSEWSIPLIGKARELSWCVF
jgi:hypothetical protein